MNFELMADFVFGFETNIIFPPPNVFMNLETVQSPVKTYPMTAKAGSSWRSKGKSNRKRVLNRAVMVSGGRKNSARVRKDSKTNKLT